MDRFQLPQDIRDQITDLKYLEFIEMVLYKLRPTIIVPEVSYCSRSTDDSYVHLYLEWPTLNQVLDICSDHQIYVYHRP